MSKIQQFHDLHFSQELLFIGNAWDVLSALTLEKAGFQAIGTTSWGIANSLGYADGEQIDFQRHLTIIQSITEQVNIPVSANIEAGGYGHDEQKIIDNVLRAADVGVAGINIEDSLKHQAGLRSIIEHCHLITNVRKELDNHGYKNFFINARTDTYFQLERPFEETMTRAKAYIESGASGVFIPGLTDVNEIKAMACNVIAPINLLSLPGLTNVKLLKELGGVKRFSIGNALSDKIIAHLTQHAAQLLKDQDTSSLYV